MRFTDRRHAGRLLTAHLPRTLTAERPIVLGVPRGGVPVAYEVASALRAPLDVFVVRKLGVPGHDELAFGAIASSGVRVLNADVVDAYGLSEATIAAVAAREARELDRRERLFRGDRDALDLAGRVVVLIDDGLATGASMQAAIQALRQRAPARIIAAVPVAAPQTCAVMSRHADLMVCAVTPSDFLGVGAWYFDFSQTTDDEVRDLLAAAQRSQ